MTAPLPGSVLRRALVAWGLGHAAIGEAILGRSLLVAEIVGIGLVSWLAAGLADTSAYLVPFLAGAAFIGVWGWQAVDAYHRARRLEGAGVTVPERSPAAAIGWLSLPLLVWGTGFWLIGTHNATPAGVLDRFVTAWNADELATADWPDAVVAEASRAARSLGTGRERFRDVRVTIIRADDERATAVADAIHFERRESRFLGIFPGSELVPVADERILTMQLRARPVELPGGGDIGAVRWDLVSAAH
ncbi:MAG: hypothetical protein ACRDGD_12045 [Candidatus Limnocylindria bacterium]